MPRVAQYLSTDDERRADRLRVLLPMDRLLHDLYNMDPGANPCPFHADKSPSFFVYPGDRGYHCFSCKRNGGPAEFIAEIQSWPLMQAVEWLEQRYGFAPDSESCMVKHLVDRSKRTGAAKIMKPLNFVDQHNRYRASITVPLAAEQAERWGVPLEHLMVRWAVGWDASSARYTLPVFQDGVVVDIRRRAEDGRHDKVISMPGGGLGGHLFGTQHLLDTAPRVVIVGGEKDVIIADHVLGGDGTVFVCGSLGESNWRQRWSERLRGFNLVVWYDNDDTGRTGSLFVAREVSSCAEKVSIVQWPVTAARRWDVADVIKNVGADAARSLLEGAQVHKLSAHDRVRSAVWRSMRCPY